ncbi:hypothetical protein AKJ09_03336 [Labilithrix luteola]|uniref:Uncharacterized protein n=2 Tax=Labilithrix luteola TaxID=1391654 RepID=A0A0K1PT27_9BACT|nr:hypothetical protein AKJ09_03336 [Labilithrix luteola]
MTVSRLAPYSSWDDLASFAAEEWTRFEQLVAPKAVSRLGLRYINKVVLPAGHLRLEDWFNTHSQMPEVLGQMSEFLSRAQIQHPKDPRLMALVTVGSTPNATPGHAFLMDIDVWTPALAQSSVSIWEVLPNLRVFKNDIFFGSITDRTLERIRTS